MSAPVNLYVAYDQEICDVVQFSVTKELIEELVNNPYINDEGYSLVDVLSNSQYLLDIINKAYAEDAIEPTDIQETYREDTDVAFDSQPTLPLFGGIEE